jgi:hypothetical protein
MPFMNTVSEGAGLKATARKLKRAGGVVALSAALLGAIPLASAGASTTDTSASAGNAGSTVSQVAASVPIMTVYTNHVAYYSFIGDTAPDGYVDAGQKADVVCEDWPSSSVVVNFWGGATHVNLPMADYLGFTETPPPC